MAERGKSKNGENKQVRLREIGASEKKGGQRRGGRRARGVIPPWHIIFMVHLRHQHEDRRTRIL